MTEAPSTPATVPAPPAAAQRDATPIQRAYIAGAIAALVPQDPTALAGTAAADHAQLARTLTEALAQLDGPPTQREG